MKLTRDLIKKLKVGDKVRYISNISINGSGCNNTPQRVVLEIGTIYTIKVLKLTGINHISNEPPTTPNPILNNDTSVWWGTFELVEGDLVREPPKVFGIVTFMRSLEKK